MRARLLLAAFLALLPSAAADVCAPSSSQPVATLPLGVDLWAQTGHEPTPATAQGVYYVARNSDVWSWTGGDTVVYQEGNAMEGLQRGDELVDDTCRGMIARDLLVWLMQL